MAVVSKLRETAHFVEDYFLLLALLLNPRHSSILDIYLKFFNGSTFSRDGVMVARGLVVFLFTENNIQSAFNLGSIPSPGTV